ncbi:MAG TPA: hypothetical protein VMS64_33230 [Candidatus Methylomirabilis sp.]|nr:hypothetical protein [Candidatus Methylomirabilis sp.]
MATRGQARVPLVLLLYVPNARRDARLFHAVGGQLRGELFIALR